jgi:hypothetical protein
MYINASWTISEAVFAWKKEREREREREREQEKGFEMNWLRRIKEKINI